jgi:hypothetical protein
MRHILPICRDGRFSDQAALGRKRVHSPRNGPTFSSFPVLPSVRSFVAWAAPATRWLDYREAASLPWLTEVRCKLFDCSSLVNYRQRQRC